MLVLIDINCDNWLKLRGTKPFSGEGEKFPPSNSLKNI